MIVGSGEHTYEWVEDWARIPDTESARTGYAHHGITVTRSGQVVSYHQDEPRLLVFDSEGFLVDSWETGLVEGHGITAVMEGDTEYLWIADNGAKARKQGGYQRPVAPVPGWVSGRVVKMTLDGRTVMALERPPLTDYRDSGYSPTAIAVNEERHGGNGDIWVADGYGQFHIHRYDNAGNYIGSINGDEGPAGRFNLPHDICIDTRKSDPELYVGDEWNRRLQVYDLEGNFKRVIGSDYLTKPCAVGVNGDLLMVLELGSYNLRARLWLLDRDDRPVALLGDNPKVDDTDAWPNMRNEDGELVRSSRIEPGKFHSPHAIAADGNGNIYIAEVLIGGRVIKLRRQ